MGAALERCADEGYRVLGWTGTTFFTFHGAVVLESRGGFSAGRVPTFQIVDGQQRLTTFQLFLAAARDYAIQSGFSGSAERIRDYLLNDKPSSDG